MNLIKSALFILAAIAMTSCKKTLNNEPVKSKSDKLAVMADTYILRAKTDNYYVKKGYITFKTLDTTFTLTAPKDSIWLTWASYKAFPVLRTGIFTRNNGTISITINVPDTLKSNSVYNVDDFDFYSYRKQGSWAWQSYLNLSDRITLKLDQYNTPPVLGKGTFSGIAQRTYKSAQGYVYQEEKVTGEFYLELTKK